MSRDLFGFKDEPFSAFPDNKYFFSSINHDKAITLLEYGLNSRKGFMLLTGLKGTGKTMTCSILKENMSDCNTSMITYTPMSPDALMKKICEGFGLSVTETDKKALLGRVMEYFVEEYKDGKNNLIVIDNAETISDDNLNMLSEFMEIEIEKCKLVQVVLSGCPELHDKLRSLGGDLGPKFTFTVELAPLSLADTIEYVEHRILTAIDDDETHLFKANSFVEIYNYSKGIPTEINRIAQKALSIAKEKKQNKVTSRHVRMAAARLYGVKATRRSSKWPYAAVILIAILAGGYFTFQDRVDSVIGGTAKEPVQVTQSEDILPSSPPPPTVETPAVPAETEQPAAVETPATAAEEAPSAEVPAAVEEKPAETPAESVADVPAEEPAVAAEPEPAAEEAPVVTAPPAEEKTEIKHGCISAMSGLKIRDGSSVNSTLIGTAPYMAYIELVELSSDGKWWKTMYDGQIGYMYAKYIQIVNDPSECR